MLKNEKQNLKHFYINRDSFKFHSLLSKVGFKTVSKILQHSAEIRKNFNLVNFQYMSLIGVELIEDVNVMF